MDKSKEDWDFYSLNGEKIEHCDAIFPIVQIENGALTIVGTSFYISTNGIFISSKHCFKPNLKKERALSYNAIHFVKESTYLQRPIASITAVNFADIAIGFCTQMKNNKTSKSLSNQILSLSAERPRAGSSIASFSFAESNVKLSKSKTYINLRKKLHEGKITNYYPTGRDRSMINWPVFETDMELRGGASGGPVFLEETGEIFAINTSGLEGVADVSYITPIDLILDIEIKNVTTPFSSEPSTHTIRSLSNLNLLAMNHQVQRLKIDNDE